MAYEMDQPLSVETHSRAEGESGEVFGMKGREFMLPLITLLISVGAIFIATIFNIGSMWWRFPIGLIPLAFGVFWTAFFVVNKPPHFARDFFEQLFEKPHLGLEPFWQSHAEAAIIAAHRKAREGIRTDDEY